MDNTAQSSNTTPTVPDPNTQPTPVTPTDPANAQMPAPQPTAPETSPTPTESTPAPAEAPATPTPEPAPTNPEPQPAPPPPPTIPDPPAPAPADPPTTPVPADPPVSTPTTPPADTSATPTSAASTPESPATPAVTPTPEPSAPTVTPAPEPPAATTAPAAPTDAKPADKPSDAPGASLSGSQTPPPPAQPQAKHFHVSPWTILLLVVLAGFAGFFAYVAFTPKTKSVPATQQSAVPTPKPVAQTVLSLQPSQPSTQGAQLGTQSYDVVIDSNSNIVNAVQLELSYDPAVLTNVSIVPGTFFANPGQLVKDIDVKNGRISYALGAQPKDKGVKGTGVVAQIMFQFNPAATVSSTMITFLPKTLVAAQGINPSVLKSTTDATITLPGKAGAIVTKTPTLPVTATATLSPTTAQ